MSSENMVILMGFLGADPELRYTQNSIAVANARLATNESYKTASGDVQEMTEWHRLTFWGKLAEIASQYLRKGSRVYVTGKLQTRTWEDVDGIKRYATEVRVDKMKFMDSAPKNKPADPNDTTTPVHQSAVVTQVDDDDDLPF